MSALEAESRMTSNRKLHALALTTVLALFASHAVAQEAETPPRQKWSFAGPFGIYDEAQLQRGLKIYREVCQTCHALSHVAFRNLGEAGGPGFSPAQVKAIAAEYQINDGPNEQGEMFQRPGRPADHFPSPYPNDAAGRAAHNGVLPPDLSLIAKARGYERGFPWFIFDIFTQYTEEGPDYIAALLQGYEEAPQGFQMPQGAHYNKYFPGHALQMPPPLTNGQVEYTDGTPADLPHYAQDVSAFLQWAAEPHLVARKRVGFQVMVFLVVFAGLLYFTKKKVWASAPGHA
jgi:ubiquinol-cytochrome c reductase cytochrome b/c1 subunit